MSGMSFQFTGIPRQVTFLIFFFCYEYLLFLPYAWLTAVQQLACARRVTGGWLFPAWLAVQALLSQSLINVQFGSIFLAPPGLRYSSQKHFTATFIQLLKCFTVNMSATFRYYKVHYFAYLSQIFEGEGGEDPTQRKKRISL